MRLSLSLITLLLLAACGGADPTPNPDEAADATEINASVEGATEGQKAAEEMVENRQDAENRARESRER